jgi:signal transduction histidine kinase
MLPASVIREEPVDARLLRSLFLFEALSPQELEALEANTVLAGYDAGIVFAEGDPARYFFILVEGELAVSKRVGERDVETSRTTHRGTYCGATAAFIEDAPEKYSMSVRATRPARLVRMTADFFGHFVRARYPMAVHLLQGLIVDHESVHRIVDQQHRIQAAGTLTAGLMHGLNNPVGAISRIAGQLRTRDSASRHNMIHRRLSPRAAAVYDMLRCESIAAVQTAVGRSALQLADREDQIDDWLTHRGVDESWNIAPVLAAGGLDVNWLQHAATALDQVDASCDIPAVVAAVADGMETLLLIDELAGASTEVSTLVSSARQYSQLDSSPLIQSDVHDLLDSSLTVMSAAMGTGITVRREYARALPSLICYAGELNQTWTNILDNAVDAIHATAAGEGVITVRTTLADEGVVGIQICDNGIGIPAGIRDRVFLPFFTTKPVGEGIGMGLDLAWRVIVGMHRGTLSVASVPRDTRLNACLPIRGAEPVR